MVSQSWSSTLTQLHQLHEIPAVQQVQPDGTTFPTLNRCWPRFPSRGPSFMLPPQAESLLHPSRVSSVLPTLGHLSSLPSTQRKISHTFFGGCMTEFGFYFTLEAGEASVLISCLCNGEHTPYSLGASVPSSGDGDGCVLHSAGSVREWLMFCSISGRRTQQVLNK